MYERRAPSSGGNIDDYQSEDGSVGRASRYIYTLTFVRGWIKVSLPRMFYVFIIFQTVSSGGPSRFVCPLKTIWSFEEPNQSIEIHSVSYFVVLMLV